MATTIVTSAILSHYDGKLKAFVDSTYATKAEVEALDLGDHNVIEAVKVNGTALAVADKAVDVTVPTALTDLTNDGNFVQDASYVHTDENFTAALKTKLNGIAEGAQVNVLEGVKVNGVALTATEKVVDVTVPTKTSDLSNDSDFVSDAAYVHTDSNFTAAEKTKLGGIEAEAQVNIIETVSVNGTAQTVTNKGVDIAVPTNNNQLTNGAGYQTASDVQTAIEGAGHTTMAAVEAKGYQTASDVETAITAKNYTTMAAVEAKGYQTSSDVDSAISTALTTVTDVKGVKATQAELPASGNKTGDVWFVTEGSTEFIWSGTAWQEFGRAYDFSGFVQKSDLVEMTTAQVDALFA